MLQGCDNVLVVVRLFIFIFWPVDRVKKMRMNARKRAIRRKKMLLCSIIRNECRRISEESPERKSWVENVHLRRVQQGFYHI